MRICILGALAIAAATPLPAQPDLYDTSTLRSFYVTFKDTNWWSLLVQNKSSATNIKADLRVDNVVLRDIGVRFKGNTSYSFNPNSEKKPFNLQFDAFVPDQRLYGYEHVNLQNAYKDATFVREPIAYELMRRYIPSLESNWIKLYLDNQYWGVYVMVQQANTRFLGEHFAYDDGNLYRGDGERRNTRPVFRYWGENIASYSRLYDYKTIGHPKPWRDLIDFCRVLNNTALQDLPKKLPVHLDVDEALWYIALHNILVNTDSYLGTGNDYYAYSDPQHGRFQILSWDLNTAFGGYDWGRILGNNRHLMRIDYSGGSAIRPLIERLLAVPQYRERYHAHLRTMLDEFFDWRVIGPMVSRYQKLLEPAVRADTKKLYATQLFFDNATSDVIVRDRYGSYTIPGLKSFVDRRRAYLLGLPELRTVPPTLAALVHSPPTPTPKDNVVVTVKVTGQAAAVVTLYSRTIGTWTETRMWDDGKHGDGNANDGVYGASIPQRTAGYEVQYYVGASASSGAVRFLPAHAGVGPQRYRLWPARFASPVRINEVLADNDSVDKDQAGEFEDWIEVHNASGAPVDISGYYLTDRVDQPKRYRFPANTVLPARGFARVWCDEEPAEGPDHADFKLAKGGEQVALFSDDKGGVVMLDTVVFGQQRSDTSFGFVPDGGRQAYFLFDPKAAAPVTGAGPGDAARYDTRSKRSPSGFDLDFAGSPIAGKTLSLELSGGPALAPAFFGFSVAPARLPLGPLGDLVLDPAAMVVVGVSLDQNGARSLGSIVPVSLAGSEVYVQAAARDLSNGLAVRFSR